MKPIPRAVIGNVSLTKQVEVAELVVSHSALKHFSNK